METLQVFVLVTILITSHGSHQQELQRGAVLNAVKLTYNPSQTQRDRLYSIESIQLLFSPGGGIALFGDKTGLAKSSAFDRINVRRLFIYLEDAISAAARDQLFRVQR